MGRHTKTSMSGNKYKQTLMYEYYFYIKFINITDDF